MKSYNMSDNDKINVFNKIQDIDTFYGTVKVFDKNQMRKIKYIF